MSLQLETNKTPIQFTDLSLLNPGSLYKIRMNSILIEGGNLFRYVNTKIFTRENNTNGYVGKFYHFILHSFSNEYISDNLISMYSFEEVPQGVARFSTYEYANDELHYSDN